MGRKLIIKYGNPIPMSDLDPGKSDPERYETISSRVLSCNLKYPLSFAKTSIFSWPKEPEAHRLFFD